MNPTLFLLLSLVAVPPVFAQRAPALESPAPITLKLVDTRLEEAIAMIGRFAGITIQWDATVTEEARSQTVTVSFVNAQLVKALALVLDETGLTYVVVEAKTVRITPAAR